MISDAEPERPSANALLSMAFGICLALTALPASAQQPDDGTRAPARDLAAEGIEAYQAQEYACANRMLDKAYRLLRHPGSASGRRVPASGAGVGSCRLRTMGATARGTRTPVLPTLTRAAIAQQRRCTATICPLPARVAFADCG